jgi:hypothetical protein
MPAINVVLKLFSGIRTRREVKCTVTCAAIGNSVVSVFCSCTVYVNVCGCCVRRGTGQCIFLRARDERQVVEPDACLGTEFRQQSASSSLLCRTAF